MAPLVRVFSCNNSADQESEVFVPFPYPRHDATALQHALPTLRNEISKRWPGAEVRIKYEIPRMRNPIDPAQAQGLMVTFSQYPAVGISVIFAISAGVAGGKAFGKEFFGPVGKELSKIVVGWLKPLERKKRVRKEHVPRRKDRKNRE